jgi:hypothetical protein
MYKRDEEINERALDKCKRARDQFEGIEVQQTYKCIGYRFIELMLVIDYEEDCNGV